MNGLIQDLRYAVRQLRKSPGFTTVAVLTLALGIGANTGIFTLVDAVLLKSLPAPHPKQLYVVRENDWLPEDARFSYPLFQKVHAALPRDAEVAAMTWPGKFYATLGSHEPQMVTGQLVSGNYFQTLETYPVLGRLLDSGDDRVIDGSPVAVISYGCWQRDFGRDNHVIGRKITVDGMPIEVVGVAAPGFFGSRVGVAPDFWLPTAMQSAVHYAQHYSQSEDAKFDRPWLPQKDIRWLQFVFRVRNAGALPQTAAALNQVFRQDLEQDVNLIKNPEERQARRRFRVQLQPGARGLSNLRQGYKQPLLVLMGMVGLVLLIACANLANLLLARASARERELAIRLSIGAGRRRLMRQLLTEYVVLSACGAVLGIGIAYWVSAALPRWTVAEAAPIPLNLAPDARVLMFSTVVAILTGVLFGLAPAIQTTRIHPVDALKENARGLLTAGRGWSIKQILVAGQIALSLVLLAGAGLFLRTLRNYAELDPGFDRDHIVTVWLDTHLAGYTETQLPSLYDRLLDRMQSLPGVRSAALSSCGLAVGCGDSSDIYLPGVPHVNGETDSQERRVSRQFFATTGIPLIEGREFSNSDTEKSPPVVLVNQTFVREFLQGKDALGQYFGYDSENTHRFQIVGVVKDARVNDIRELAPPMIYHSLEQDMMDVESLDIRTLGDPAQTIPRLREAIQSVDPNLPVGGISTLAEQVSNNLAQQKLIARLTTIFGLLALGLACLGLYGVISYTVARRTGEIGVRLALGAPRWAVTWLVLHEVLAVIGFGIVIGLPLSLLAAHAIRSLLFGLSPNDPATIAGAVAVLGLVAIFAGLKPAWRAAQVNPTDALRVE